MRVALTASTPWFPCKNTPDTVAYIASFLQVGRSEILQGYLSVAQTDYGGNIVTVPQQGYLLTPLWTKLTMPRPEQAHTHTTCLDLGDVASSERVVENDFKKSRQQRNILPSGRSLLCAVCILGLAAVCCLLHLEYRTLSVRQSQLEHQLASLVKFTDKMLQDRGLHRDSQLEFEEIVRVARDQENKNPRWKFEDSGEDVENIRRKRDASENGRVGHAPSVRNTRRRRPKNPRGLKTLLSPCTLGGAANCSDSRVPATNQDYPWIVKRGHRSPQDEYNPPSIHMVGTEGRIQMKNTQYFTWKHSHLSGKFDLCHRNQMKQKANEFIVIPQSGMYYVYSQVMYSDGRSPNVGHTTVLKRRDAEVVLMRSGSTEVDTQNVECTKGTFLSPSDSAYHGGVFKLSKGDRLGVSASAPGECFASSPEQTYFGAFMVSASVPVDNDNTLQNG
ncbi:uncharacterized protein [Ptychodera flava]|uniref:uncharacterized protein n=1 Tax=Ptychodera flava TaxID=63121 RepID=UPI00396A8A63